jgi:hypothetical protein
MRKHRHDCHDRSFVGRGLVCQVSNIDHVSTRDGANPMSRELTMPVLIFGAEKSVGLGLIRTMRLVETDIRDGDGICVWFLGD